MHKCNYKLVKYIKKKMNRIKIINPNTKNIKGRILYLMTRDCRIKDNHALIFAQKKCQTDELIIGYIQTNEISKRQLPFLLEGLSEVYEESKKLNIAFTVIDNISEFIKKYNIIEIVIDFSPLKQYSEFIKKIDIPLTIVDTHNIIPVWLTSDKQEYSARTIRPKILNHLKDFLKEPEKVYKMKKMINVSPPNFNLIVTSHDSETLQNKVFKGGYSNGLKKLKTWNLKGYSESQNNYKKNNLSNLSPWLHFGFISSLRIVLFLIKNKNKNKPDVEKFFEEIIVRKELAENFCYYNNNYDSIEGIPDWSKKTLEKHLVDKREEKYTYKQLETANTNSKSWNFCQKQLLETGKLHSYLRMYWAKKIIEWTENYSVAHSYALTLNDKYSLDGNDPNGFVGVSWCFGLHDRPWKERKIYGKVRYMNKIEKDFKN